MKNLDIFFLGAVFLFSATCLAAQAPIQDRISPQAAQERQRQQANEAAVKRLQNIMASKTGPQGSPDTGSRQRTVFRSQRDEEAIAVDRDDRETYGAFLKGAHTGITRLQNASVCPPDGRVVEANCPNNIYGKATGFSFREEDYRGPRFADIFFDDNRLSISGMLTLGVLSNLGVVDIDSLTLQSNGVRQLVEFEPPENQDEVIRVWQILNKGVQIDKFIYKREVELKDNSTYVLRVVAYHGRIAKSKGSDKINLIESDKRKDVLVIFKPVRKNFDGSVNLIWKILKKVESPKVVLKGK